MQFKDWLRLHEEGGLFGNPGTPFPDGHTPTTSGERLYKNRKVNAAGCSGGPCPKKGGTPLTVTPPAVPLK